jgi:hypothetical protein
MLNNQTIQTNGIISPVDKNTFSTKTQYDKTLDYLYKDYPQAKRGVSGPVFAIVTACEYLKLPLLTKEKHEMNINRSVTISSVLTLNGNMSMESLIKNTDIPENSIVNVTVPNFAINDPTLLNIIPDINNTGRFCTIIHKNNKFFVVIGDHTMNRYCIRDCNEPIQYNFATRIDLIDYLSNIYYLNKEFIIDGEIVPGYSHVAYVVVKQHFKEIFDQHVERVILKDNIIANGNHINQPNYEHVQCIPQLRCNNNGNNAFIGYVNNIPNDNVDMNALQRQFGDMNDERYIRVNNHDNRYRYNYSNCSNSDDSYDSDDNNCNYARNNRGFVPRRLTFNHADIQSDSNDNEYNNDSDEDAFFNEDN